MESIKNFFKEYLWVPDDLTEEEYGKTAKKRFVCAGLSAVCFIAVFFILSPILGGIPLISTLVSWVGIVGLLGTILFAVAGVFCLGQGNKVKEAEKAKQYAKEYDALEKMRELERTCHDCNERMSETGRVVSDKTLDVREAYKLSIAEKDCASVGTERTFYHVTYTCSKCGKQKVLTEQSWKTLYYNAFGAVICTENRNGRY